MITQTDVNATHEIEIIVSRNGGFVWINVDGVCALRVVNRHKTAVIAIEDTRKETIEYQHSAFEQWCKHSGLIQDWTRYGNGYAKPRTELAWQAWKQNCKSTEETPK